MPQTTMRDEDTYPLPDETPFPARLESVEVKTIQFEKKDRKTGAKTGEWSSFDKWVWDFQITSGQYAGLHAYGETEDRLTNHPDNKVRQWAETLRDAPFEIGEGLNTDDLVGLPCIVTVRHDEPRPKKDGGNFYPCPVDDVFPEGALPVDDEPPF